jgi:hypothetical protein
MNPAQCADFRGPCWVARCAPPRMRSRAQAARLHRPCWWCDHSAPLLVQLIAKVPLRVGSPGGAFHHSARLSLSTVHHSPYTLFPPHTLVESRAVNDPQADPPGRTQHGGWGADRCRGAGLPGQAGGCRGGGVARQLTPCRVGYGGCWPAARSGVRCHCWPAPRAPTRPTASLPTRSPPGHPAVSSKPGPVYSVW